MDPRVREHAEIVLDHCIDAQPDDDVLIQASPAAEDLVVALYAGLGERGAGRMRMGVSNRAYRAYLRNADPDALSLDEHELAAIAAADKVVMLWGHENTRETSDVDPEVSAANARVQEPIQDERLEKPWVGTQYPTTANAQEAEMSTEAYADFVYRAISKDWAAQREFQQQLVEILEPAAEVRIRSGDATDLRLSIEGMKAINDAGERNLPGGEVFTVPVPDSVEGDVLFDKPVLRQGREVLDARLVFEGGEVVEHAAAKNEDLLTAVLNTDPGARRLGELGIGMNRDIDRFTYNMLFDEKMGDTVHLALGDAIDRAVPDGREANESADHVDMIVDMAEDSIIEVDGEVVQRNGTFRFEAGFEGS